MKYYDKSYNLNIPKNKWVKNKYPRNSIIAFATFALLISACGQTDSSPQLYAPKENFHGESESANSSETSVISDSENAADSNSTDIILTRTDKYNSEEMHKKLIDTAGISEDDIRVFHIDDFDNDGEYEAFAITGVMTDYDYDESLVEGSIWFINNEVCEKLTENNGMGYSAIDCTLNFGGRKYFLFDDVFATGKLTYVFTVNGKKAVQTPFSRRGTLIADDTNPESFRIIDSSYDAEYDPGIISTIGHTWKSYYFYYDSKTDSINEYGGIEISPEDAKSRSGHDLVSEVLSEGDEHLNIIFRLNGLLHINYSRNDEDGCILYLHRTYDSIRGCYIDDYNEISDEESPGTYNASLCPDIAVFPAE